MATKIDRPLVRRRHTVFPDRTLSQLHHFEFENVGPKVGPNDFFGRHEVAAQYSGDAATNQLLTAQCCKKVERCRSFVNYGERSNILDSTSAGFISADATEPVHAPTVTNERRKEVNNGTINVGCERFFALAVNYTYFAFILSCLTLTL